MHSPIKNTIPKKVLVAVPDFLNPQSGQYRIVPPEEAFVPAFDRSFHFGDSLYEVVRSYDGILFSMDEHMERLRNSAKMAMFEEMPDTDQIAETIRTTCRAFFKKFGNIDVYARVTLSRGFGDMNIDPSYSSSPYAYIFVKELDLPKEKYYQEGVRYDVVERRRNLPSALDPAMKSGNYLNNVLAIAEAKKNGPNVNDAVMLNYQGFVTEGTTNNFYIVKNNEVWTAPLSVGILEGITRKWLFEICKRKGATIRECLFTSNDLFNADEAFLSSSTKELMPITQINEYKVGTGKPGLLTQNLMKSFKELVQEFKEKHANESLFQK